MEKFKIEQDKSVSLWCSMNGNDSQTYEAQI